MLVFHCTVDPSHLLSSLLIKIILDYGHIHICHFLVSSTLLGAVNVSDNSAFIIHTIHKY